MKDRFREYYRPTDTEFQELWNAADFAIDANVLLNIYGYTKTTRATLLDLFSGLRARLWMPYQFAFEYQRRRVRAILEQVDNYRSISKKLSTILDEHFRVKHRHPFVSQRSLHGFERLCRELESGEREHEALLTDDPYFRQITEFLDGRVGGPPTEEQLQAIYAQARQRFERLVPPGYLDRQKPEPDRYGDVVGWREILDHGAAEHHSLVLLTDDRKEDWWHVEGGRHLGPRKELIAEYRVASGQAFHMYTLEQFITRAPECLGRPVEAQAIREVQGRTESQRSVSAEKPIVLVEDGPDGPKDRSPQKPDSYEIDMSGAEASDKPEVGQ